MQRWVWIALVPLILFCVWFGLVLTEPLRPKNNTAYCIDLVCGDSGTNKCVTDKKHWRNVLTGCIAAWNPTTWDDFACIVVYGDHGYYNGACPSVFPPNPHR